MKKLISITLSILILCISTNVFAQYGYSLEFKYNGEVVEGEAKTAKVKLIGENGTYFTNARVDISVTGPATPIVYAYENNGNKVDLMKVGYWGTYEGFPIAGTFVEEITTENTFTKPGEYVITLNLVDTTSNSLITTISETVHVVALPEEEINKNNIQENIIEELPAAGITIWQYIIMCSIFILILAIVICFYKKKV